MEVGVELDVDLSAIGERDLDLVVAVLVADLGVGDPALTGVVRSRRLVERRPGDRSFSIIAPTGSGCATSHEDPDGNDSGSKTS